MLLLRATPRVQRVTAVQTTGDASELLLNGSELAERDWQQALVAQRDAVFQLQLLLEPLLAEPE